MKGSRSLIVGIVITIALVAGATFAVVATRASSSPSHQMQIDFPSADGLVSGSDVLEAGAKIGYISDIQPTQNNSALVTVVISGDHWPIHNGVTADIRPKSLLGEKYVDLHDGTSTNAVYDASVTVHANQTADPVELDQFINSLDPATRTAVRVLLDDLGAGVAGRGNDLNAAIAAGKADLSNLAVFGTTLNNRDADLDKILVGLDGILAKLTTSDQLTQMSQLITNGQNTLNDIQQVQTQFSRQFTNANLSLADLNVAFDGAVPSLRATLDVSGQLISNLTTETGLLRNLALPLTTPNGAPNATDQALCNQSPSTPLGNNLGPGIPQCSPLWFLIKGLLGGPTTSGGATETPGVTNPIFRICLSLPASGAGSCENTVASQQTAYSPSTTGVNATFASLLAS